MKLLIADFRLLIAPVAEEVRTVVTANQQSEISNQKSC
jgi:hypothetical protein